MSRLCKNMIGRIEELDLLENLYNSNKFDFVESHFPFQKLSIFMLVKN